MEGTMNSVVPDPVQPRPARLANSKAAGITLAPGPGRVAALMLVGVPLLIIMVIGFVTKGGGGGTPGYSGLPAGGYSQTVTTTQASDIQDPAQPAAEGVSYSSSPISSPAASSPVVSSPAAVTPSATDTASAAPASPVSATASSPAATVQAAYEAVNRHDYAAAYALGLGTPGQSYTSFVAGYQGTASVALTVTGAEGDTVTVTLTATQEDGSQQTYGGTYTVSDGHIVSAQIQQVG
jgi:hypothetical protein